MFGLRILTPNGLASFKHSQMRQFYGTEARQLNATNLLSVKPNPMIHSTSHAPSYPT